MTEDTSASTPNYEALREWASEWSDIYDQGQTEGSLTDLVGKHVKGYAEVNGEAKGFEGTIVGYSADTLLVPSEDRAEWIGSAHRFSVILSSGVGCPIFAGMKFEETIEE